MKKRLISIAVALSIIVSLCTFNIYSSAATSYVSPNMAILENILYGDRQFVIDTLIGTNFKTDFSTNPHALVNYIGDENAMMDNVLSQYQNKDDPNYSAAYKAAVDIMEKIYNGEDYIQGAADWVTSFAADLLSIFSNDAQTVMNDLTYSVSQLQYESILKEALAADYTSSNGTELSTTEIELENLKRLSDAVGCLKAFQAFAYSYGKANNYDGKSEEFRNAYDYYTQYLTSYSDSIEKALGSFSDVMNFGDTDDIVSFIALMGTVAQYDLHCAELKAFDSDIPLYAAEYFVSDEDLKTMKFDKSVISGVDDALSAYMFINSIATQRDSIGDTLTRMSKTANPYLKPILVKFAGEVGEAGNAKLMGYESLMRVLRAENATVDFAKWGTKKLSEKSSIIKSFKKKALTDTALSKTISGATNVANISSWCADKAMSFGDTCKKTYELKYLKTLIAQAIVTYEDDLEVYLNNKTDENAKIVLDDLLMIQKLRLRGETIAYKMTEGQWNSPLGRLLATGTLDKDKMLMDYLKEAYQSRVDAFIGASAMPFTTDSLTIKNGETLTINYDNAYGGLYATYQKSDGTTRGIGELQYRIANGLIVEKGGTVRTLSNGVSASIPYINNNGGTVQLLGNIKLLEYSQSSGATTLGPYNYQIGSAYFSGGTIETGNGGTLSCGDLSVSGTLTPNFPITCTNNMNVSGTINGNAVYLKGNYSGSGSIDTLYVNGNNIQNLSDSLNVKDLTFTNSGTANQTGTIYVSNSVKNESSKVTNGQNTVLKSTGSIIGNHYNSSITLDGVTIDKDISFNGNIHPKNTVSLSNITISGGIVQNSGNVTLNGDVNASGDSYFNGNVAQDEGVYYTKGDISVSRNNTFNAIVTNGKLLQNISGAVNVNNFTNNNLKGLKIGSTVSVSGVLTNTCGKIQGMGMTLLSGGSFGADTYNGDVTIKSTCNIPSNISGTVSLYANETINRDTQIGGDFTINSGTLSVNDSDLVILGKLVNHSTITANENSNVICNSSITNNRTMTGKGSYTIKGILINSGTISECDLILSKELSNSNYININSLTTNSEVYNGSSLSVVDLYLKPKTFFAVGGNAVNTNNLYLQGSGKVVLNTKINVSGEYVNSGVKVNDDKIIISSGKTITEDRTYKDLNVTTDLMIDNCTLTVDTLTVSGSIKLTNGAKLVINKKLYANGSSDVISISEDSALTIKKISNIKSYKSILIDGILTFGSDVSISSSTITGSGTVNVNGDFYCNSVTINKPKNFIIRGKTPQVITCSGASFDNLNVSNSCRAGVTFQNTVYYYGSYDKGTSNVSGTVTKK